jgi:hypothetical protein
MKKLTLEHLAPYLPYGLKMKVCDPFYKYEIMTLCDASGLSNIGISTVIDEPQDFKPILRPLSDLTKKIEDNGNKFVPIDYINQHYLKCTIDKDGIVNDGIDKYEILFLPYCLIKELLQLHFDVFGLIEKGLAIDINTLES